MMDDATKQKRFLWGTALAWAPGIPMLIGLGYAFAGINGSKATGIAAVAGGFVEMYVWVGIAATLICEVSAMAMLFRAFSSGHGVRSALSAVSICVSSLVIVLFGLSLWLLWFARHNAF